MRVLVTGGAGFIGSALIRHLIQATDHEVLNLDKLTRANALSSLEEIADDPRYAFRRGDICDCELVGRLFEEYQPDVVVHLAAESHVDRSINRPEDFIQANVIGTFSLVQEALAYWSRLDPARKEQFRFHHVSTDEVFGSLGDEGYFVETTPYNPSSPYSASKAASDHLVRAWGHTYGLPVLITYCSNNYGPYHFPEKLIPLIITRALAGQPLPVYGDGGNVRDWLFVEDHARALRTVFETGVPGETYNIGGNSERRNIDVVQAICAGIDRLCPRDDGRPYSSQIVSVTDRPGHDHRYAIDADKIREELGWEPRIGFEDGIDRTVRWYLDRRDWWESTLGSPPR